MTATINTRAQYVELFKDPEIKSVRFHGEQVTPREVTRFFPVDGKAFQFKLCYLSFYE